MIVSGPKDVVIGVGNTSDRWIAAEMLSWFTYPGSARFHLGRSCATVKGSRILFDRFNTDRGLLPEVQKFLVG